MTSFEWTLAASRWKSAVSSTLVVAATLAATGAEAADRQLVGLILSAVEHGSAGPIELSGEARDQTRKTIGRPAAVIHAKTWVIRPHSRQPECKHVGVEISSPELMPLKSGGQAPLKISMAMQVCPDGQAPSVLDPVDRPIRPRPPTAGNRPMQTLIPSGTPLRQ
jgi:hypothetical protein